MVFVVLVGYIFFTELNTSGIVSNHSKDISIIPNTFTIPNITSSNMTSSVVDSMETVVARDWKILSLF